VPRLPHSYARHPRPILWLLREGRLTLRGASGAPQEVEVRPFYLAKAPVTNAQYEAFDPSHRRAAPAPGDEDPVVEVSFHEATAYCAWYAEVSRKPMRLPTEIEWEYACRAGNGAPDVAGADAWSVENSSGQVRDPRLKRANPFGLWGMLGCVWEWTAAADETAVLRGGSFREPVRDLTCAARRRADPDLRADDVGFRIARSF